MPQFRPSILITDAYGSAGDVTWYHRNGKCYTRKRSHPAYRGTAGQLEHLDVHRRALAAWRSISHQTQLVWNALAEDVEPHRPPFDHKANISGQNLFVSAYHGFAQLGREHVPEPQPFPEFPSAALELLQIIPGTGVATLRCRLTLTDTVHPERWHLTAKILLTAPGVGFNPGLMRTYRPTSISLVSIGPTISTRAVTFTVQQKSTQRGQNPLCAHIRYRLIDETTGYRNICASGCGT